MKKLTSRVASPTRPNWQRKILSQAIAMAGAGLQASAALAACPTTPVAGADVATCTVSGGQTATINTGGSIIVAGGPAIQLSGAGNKAIVNSGTLTGTVNGLLAGAGIQDQFGATGTVTITNNAGAAINGTTAGIWINTASILNLTNAGTIKGSSSSSAAGMNLSGNFAGSIVNSGTITGIADGSEAGFLTATGIYIAGDMSAGATLTNSGTISGDAQDAGAITANAGGIYISSNLAGTITNSGTIRATALASTSANAAGVYVSSNVLSTGGITNSNTIAATATANGALGSASAAGIFISSAMLGTLTSSGTISATATTAIGAADAIAYGIYLGAGIGSSGTTTGSTTSSSSTANLGVAATLTNSGTITATATTATATTATSVDPDAEAVGIYVGGNVWAGSSITNAAAGRINVTATGDEGTATGIYVSESIDAGATLTNAGTITVAATATGSSAEANGIVIDDDLNGTLLNSGTINVTATGTSEVQAFGILVDSTIGATGTLTNSGAINVTAVGSSGSISSAAGIWVDSNLEGSILNSGTITVTATGSSASSVYGIYVSSTMTTGSTMTNSGTITVTATGTTSSASAVGMGADSVQGSIVNSGTITVNAVATGEGNAAAAGIYVSNSLGAGGSVTNSGTINVTADGGSGSAAVGIYISNMAPGSTLNNTGTITVRANSSSLGFSESSLASAGAIGIFVSSLASGATLTNSGTVTANTDAGIGTGWAMIVGGAGSSESGLPVISNSGTLRGNVLLFANLNNTGTLSIPVSSGAIGTFSLVAGNYTQSADGVLEIGAFDSTNYGRLVVGGTADLTASGKFAVNVAPSNLLVAGEILENVLSADTLISGGNTNLSVTDNDPFWNFTAIDDGEHGVDLVPFGQADPVLTAQGAQVASQYLNNVSSQLMGRMDVRRLIMPDGSHDQNLWFRPYGSTGSGDDSGNVPGYDVDSYGVILGYDTFLDAAEWNVGAAFSYAQTEVESQDSQIKDEIEVDTYSLSAYGFWTGADNTYIDLMVIGGVGSNESTRGLGVNGNASGDYDSWYARLSSEFGRGFPMNDKLTLTPSVNASYTYVDEDGYTETGAAGLNLTVESTDAESLVFGLDGEVAYALNPGSLLTAHIGVGYDALTDELEVNSNFGGGANFTTTGESPEEWLGRAGVGAEFVASERLELHLNYEYLYRSDFDNNLVVGTLRWKI